MVIIIGESCMSALLVISELDVRKRALFRHVAGAQLPKSSRDTRFAAHATS